jgi:filamentous hemagglutinin family protein
LALIVGKALVTSALMNGTVALSAGPLPAGIPAQIIADGKTLTTLQIQGNRTNINTNTMVGKSAVNSFQKFDVHAGNTVNLMVPTQAANLVNLVRQGVTNIDGILNSYQNGQIGGNVFMLNPNGVVVGASGVINTGSMVIAAPAMKVIDSLYKDTGFDEDAMKRLSAGEIPLTGGGRVAISGTVNATGGVSIGGSTVSIDGAIKAAGKFQGLSLATNTGGAATADSLEVVDGKILVRAAEQLDVSGKLDVSQTDGKAGQIDLRASGDLNLNAGAQLLAKGLGDTASGGDIKTWADGKTTLKSGALLNASAEGKGAGGWVEFSGNSIDIAGGTLDASSKYGEQGNAYIDPIDLTISTNLLRDSSAAGGTTSSDGSASSTTWNAGSLKIQASQSITVNNGAIISSRVLAAGVTDHVTGNSGGNSGKIEIEAPSITLTGGAKILAHATNGFIAGDVSLNAKSTGNTSIAITNATIKGRDVSITAVSDTSDSQVWINPVSHISSTVSISNTGADATANRSVIAATGNLTVSSQAKQSDPYIPADFSLFGFDARSATAKTTVMHADLSAVKDLSVTSAAETNTDLSLAYLTRLARKKGLIDDDVKPDGSGRLATKAGVQLAAGTADYLLMELLTTTPLSVKVGKTMAESSTTVDGSATLATMGATGIVNNVSKDFGNITVKSEASNTMNINAVSSTAVGGLTTSVGLASVKARTEVKDQAVLSAAEGIEVNASGKTTMQIVADAAATGSFGAPVGVAIGIAVSYADVDVYSGVNGNAKLTTTGTGDVKVVANSANQLITAARSGTESGDTEEEQLNKCEVAGSANCTVDESKKPKDTLKAISGVMDKASTTSTEAATAAQDADTPAGKAEAFFTPVVGLLKSQVTEKLGDLIKKMKSVVTKKANGGETECAAMVEGGCDENSQKAATSFQAAGGVAVTVFNNKTVAEITSRPAAGTDPTIQSGGGLTVSANASNHVAVIGSGQSAGGTIGGGAGVGVLVANNSVDAAIRTETAGQKLYVQAQGPVTVEATSKRYTETDPSKDTHKNAFGVWAFAGQGASSGDEGGVGLAGALGFAVVESNDVIARIDNDVVVKTKGQITINASNLTNVQVIADGSDSTKETSDAVFGFLEDAEANPLFKAEDTKVDEYSLTGFGGSILKGAAAGIKPEEDNEYKRGKFGLGASVAVATSSNVAHAYLAQGTDLSPLNGINPGLHIKAEVGGETSAEAKSAGDGGVAIVPLASLALARGRALAEIQGGVYADANALNLANLGVVSEQNITVKSVTDGRTGGADESNKEGDNKTATVGIGASFSVAVNLTDSQATVDRAANVSGSVNVAALGKRDVQATSKAAVNKAGEEDEGSAVVQTTGGTKPTKVAIEVPLPIATNITITALPTVGTATLTEKVNGVETTRNIAIGDVLSIDQLKKVVYTKPKDVTPEEAQTGLTYTTQLSLTRLKTPTITKPAADAQSNAPSYELTLRPTNGTLFLEGVALSAGVTELTPTQLANLKFVETGKTLADAVPATQLSSTYFKYQVKFNLTSSSFTAETPTDGNTFNGYTFTGQPDMGKFYVMRNGSLVELTANMPVTLAEMQSAVFKGAENKLLADITAPELKYKVNYSLGTPVTVTTYMANTAADVTIKAGTIKLTRLPNDGDATKGVLYREDGTTVVRVGDVFTQDEFSKLKYIAAKGTENTVTKLEYDVSYQVDRNGKATDVGDTVVNIGGSNHVNFWITAVKAPVSAPSISQILTQGVSIANSAISKSAAKSNAKKEGSDDGKAVDNDVVLKSASTDTSKLESKKDADKTTEEKKEDESASEDGKLSLAAAIALNYVDVKTKATINKRIVQTGTDADKFQIYTVNENDLTVKSDGGAGSGTTAYNIAGSAAINVYKNVNIASLNADSQVGSGQFLLGAGSTVSNTTGLIRDGALGSVAGSALLVPMLNGTTLSTEQTTGTSKISAVAQAGAGEGKLSVAGGVALNVVLQNDNLASLNANLSGLAGRQNDFTVSAYSNYEYEAKSVAKVGGDTPILLNLTKTAESVKSMGKAIQGAAGGDYSGLNTEGMTLYKALSKKFDSEAGKWKAGKFVPQEEEKEEEKSGPAGVGIGVGFAINAITTEVTRAEVKDGKDLSGRIGSVTVQAASNSKMTTSAQAGTAPDEDSEGQNWALDAAVAVGVLIKRTEAELGTGAAFTSTSANGINIKASSTTDSVTTGAGDAVGARAAVGAAVAVGVVLDNGFAKLERSVTADGPVTIDMVSASTDKVTADATASGTAVKKYADKLGVLNQDADSIVDKGYDKAKSTYYTDKSKKGSFSPATSMKALGGDFSDGDGAEVDTDPSKVTEAGDSGGGADKKKSINFAGAVGVNVSKHQSLAQVADNVVISTNGAVNVTTSNDVNYNTRGSGLTVFSDTGIGVGVAILKTGRDAQAVIGQGVTIQGAGGAGTNAGALQVKSTYTENAKGADPATWDRPTDNFVALASSEAIAGAGAGKLGIAGSLALNISTDNNLAQVGAGSTLNVASANVEASGQNRLVARAWAAALASRATCSDPGNCPGGDEERNAIGASFAVNVTTDKNIARVGDNVTIDARTVVGARDVDTLGSYTNFGVGADTWGRVTVKAEDRSPPAWNSTTAAQVARNLEPESWDSNSMVRNNYTAFLQNRSFYAEAIAGGASDNGNAFGGSVAVTVSNTQTKSLVGDGVQIKGSQYAQTATNSNDTLTMVGALSVAKKAAIGASIGVTVLRDRVEAIVGDDGDSSTTVTNGRRGQIVAHNGDTVNADATAITESAITVKSQVNQNVNTLMAAGGVSTNENAIAGAFAINVMDANSFAVVKGNTDVWADLNTSNNLGFQGSVDVSAGGEVNIKNLAASLAAGSKTSAGGTLALNLMLNDRRAAIGDSRTTDNSVTVNATGRTRVYASNDEDILTGAVGAAFSTSENALAGVLSLDVIKGSTKAELNRGVTVNNNVGIDNAGTQQSLQVIANDVVNVFDIVGSVAGGSKTSAGIALNGGVIWKETEARLDGTVYADKTVDVKANTDHDMTVLGINIAASGESAGGAALGLSLVKDETYATIGSNATVLSKGNVDVAATNTSGVFLLEMAGSFAGSNAISGSVGVGVFLSKTKAEISDNATVVGLGNDTDMMVWSKNTDYRPFGIGLDSVGSGEAAGNQATADLGGLTSDGFNARTFNKAKDLIVGKTRTRTNQRGVAVTALNDNLFLTIAPSIAAGGNNTGAVQLGVDVNVSQVEAKIGTNTHINEFDNPEVAGTSWQRSGKFLAGGSSLTPNAAQDVVVRAIGDSATISFAGGVAAGGNAGVGLGADVVVGVKNVKAHIDSGARVFAKDDIEVSAANKDTDISLAMSLGAAGSYGVSGTASVAVRTNTTQAWIGQLDDVAGTAYITPTTFVTAGDDLSVMAEDKTFGIQFSGALGAGGTAGIGAAFNVGVGLNKTTAAIGQNASTQAGGATLVEAKSKEETYAITLAGGAAGTVGVGGAISVHVLGSEANAHITGQVNQRDADLLADYSITPTAADQTVKVNAENYFRGVNAVGALGAAGTVGVGAGVNVTIAKAKANAYIGIGNSSTLVNAKGDVEVTAKSEKITDDYVVALGAAGVVGVAGAINVVLVGETMNDDAKKRLSDDNEHGGRSGSQGNAWSDIDSKTSSLNLSTALSSIGTDTSNSSDSNGQIGGLVTNVGNAYNDNSSNALVSGHFTGTNPGNYTQAFIGSNATVKSKEAGVKVAAEDSTESRTYNAAFGFAGKVGVGASIGIQVVNSTAEAFVGAGARVDSYKTLEVAAKTKERLYSGGFSGAGALVGVNGSITTAVLSSDALAYIDNDVDINQDETINNVLVDKRNTANPSLQNVMVHAEGDTKVVTTSGGGGGGLVGVGLVGSTVTTTKTTHASIGQRVDIDAGGNVTVDAASKEYLLNVAFSINGGFVGVTGVVTTSILDNTTRAYIANGANITTAGSVRVQALDDAQNWGVSVAGAGGAVGVAGDVGTNIMSNTTQAWVGEGVRVVAQGNSTVAVADGTFTTSNLSADTFDTYDSDGNKTTGGGSAVQSAVTYNTTAARGLAVNAVSREYVNHVPVGAAVGGVAVAGGIGVTLFDSTTSAEVRSSSDRVTKINTSDLVAANTLHADQSVRVSASSESEIQTFTTGIGLGAGGAVGLGIDTLVFDKQVTAKAAGSFVAKNDVKVSAQNKDVVNQKAASLAVDGSQALAGTVSVLVASSDVLAEISDSATVVAGDDLNVSASQNTRLIQTSGVVSASGGGGIGGGLGVFTDKTTTVARIGNSAVTDAADDTNVLAATTADIDQNTIAFASGGMAGASGSIGVNIFKSLTRAQIGENARINQNLAAGADQDVTVQAKDDINVQANTGAGAVGGIGGAGVGVGILIARTTTDAVIGAGARVDASDDITVEALAVKDFGSVDVAAAGGLGIGLAGSVGILQIGGAISSDAKSKGLSNDQGNIVSDVNSRAAYSADTQNSNTNGDSSYTSATLGSSRGKVSSHTNNLMADVSCSGDACANNTTSARIEAGTSSAHTMVKAKSDVTVNANEKVLVELESSGGAVGAVGVGGWVAYAQYKGQVNATVGNYTDLEVGNALSVTAKLGEKDNKDSSVKSIGVSASLMGGFAGTFAFLDMSGDANALVGNSVSLKRHAALNAGTPNVTVTAERDLDASVTSIGAAASGYGAIGISVANLESAGNINAAFGANNALGENLAKLGNVTLSAKNYSDWTARAEAGAGASGLAAVGADARVTDTGNTWATVGSNSQLFASGAINMEAIDQQSLRATTLGVTVGSVGISGNANHVTASRDVAVLTGKDVDISGASSITMQAVLGKDVAGDDRADDNIFSSATAGAGGLLGAGAGSGSYVSLTGRVRTVLGESNDIATSGAFSMDAKNFSRVNSESMGVSVGGIGSVGISVNHVDALVDTYAGFDDSNTAITAGSLSVNAYSNGRNTLRSRAGSGSLGGAAVGVESFLNDGAAANRSDTAARIAGTVNVSGQLTVNAIDVPDNTNTVEGIAVAGSGSVAGVNVDTQVHHRAWVQVGNSTQVNASAVAIASRVGDGVVKTAEVNVTSVAGALLAGIQGTDSDVVVNADSITQFGNDVHLNLSGTSSSITSKNQTYTRHGVTGVSAGLVAAGGTVGNTANTGDAITSFGQGFQVEGNSSTASTTNLTIEANSAKNDRTHVTAGSGGALSITGAQSTVTSTGETSVTLDGLSSGNADAANSLKLTKLNNLTIQSLNSDVADTELDSTNVSLAGGQGGLAQTNINTTTKTVLGNRAYLRVGGDLKLFSQNSSKKFTAGDSENFKAVGVGALDVSIGKSENYLTQNTLTQVGDYSDIFVSGDGYNGNNRKNATIIAAYAKSTMKDYARTSTGGLVAAPVAISDQTAVSHSSVSIGRNTLLETYDRDVVIYSKTEEDIQSKAVTDVYGLVSAGASARTLAQQTSSDKVSFGQNSAVRAYGTLDVLAGASTKNLLDQSVHGVSSVGIIFNATPVPISAGKRSNANLNYSATIDIAKGSGANDTVDNSGAYLLAQSDINIHARNGLNGVSQIGDNNYFVLGVPVKENFGDKTNTVTTGITNNGIVETGYGKDAWLVLDANALTAGATEQSITVGNTKPADGSTTNSRSARVKFTVRAENAASKLESQIKVLELQRDAYVVPTTSSGSDNGSSSSFSTSPLAGYVAADIGNYKLYQVTLAGESSPVYVGRLDTNAEVGGVVTQVGWSKPTGADANGNVTWTPVTAVVSTPARLYEPNSAVAGAAANTTSESTTKVTKYTTDATVSLGVYRTAATVTDSGSTYNLSKKSEVVNGTTITTYYRNTGSVWQQINVDTNGNVSYTVLNSAPAGVQNLYLNEQFVESTAQFSGGDTLMQQIAFMRLKQASMNSGTVNVVEINPISVRSGNIVMSGDYAVGAGRFIAKNDPSISIVSEGPNPFRLKAGTDTYQSALTISDVPSGAVTFNDSYLVDGAALNNKNSFVNAPSNHAANDLSVSGSTSYNPTIKVRLGYNSPDLTVTKNPELHLDGRVQNLGGLVDIENTNGTIFSNNAINGGTVKISAGGDYFVNALSNLFNIGSNPASMAVGSDLYDEMSALDTALDAQTVTIGNVTKTKRSSGLASTGTAASAVTVSNPETPTYGAAEDTSSLQSATVAGGNVVIVAQTINLNGLIQSGMPTRSLTVTDADIAALNTGTTDGTWTLSPANGSSVYAALPSGVEYTKQINATFRRENGVEWIEVDPVALKGGTVYISGKIASTGNGRINVQDGYGTVSIDNQTAKQLVVKGIDNSEVEGKVTLVDFFKTPNPTSTTPTITEYTRIGNDIQKRVYLSGAVRPIDATSTVTVANDVATNATYSPEANLRYKFMTGESFTVSGSNTTQYDQALNVPSWKVSSKYSESDYIASAGAPQSADSLPMQATIAKDAAGTTYAGDLVVNRNISMTGETGTVARRSKYYFFFTRVWETYNWTRSFQQYDTYSLNASRDISINFLGKTGVGAGNAGTTSIMSKGNVVLDGNIRSQAFATNNSVSTVSVQAGVGANSGSILAGSTGTPSIYNNNITLSAAYGSIGSVSGTDTAAMTLKPIDLVATNQTLNANITARDNLVLRANQGGLFIADLGNLNGYLSLESRDDLNVTPTSGALTAQGIRLVSQYGTFNMAAPGAAAVTTVVNTNPSADLGTLTLRVGSGNIDVEQSGTAQTPKDLRVFEISAPGDVTVSTNYGSVRDGNSNQTVDVLSTQALETIWERAQLLADPTVLSVNNSSGNATAKLSTQQSNYDKAVNQLYRDYWSMRNVNPADGTAEAYDPNFRYVASTAEKAALNNDPNAITKLENTQTARYQQAHQFFIEEKRETTYKANYAYTVVNDVTPVVRYDSEGNRVETAANARMSDGSSWNVDALRSAIPAFGLRETTDTKVFVEDANIKGNNITLRANGGAIGQRLSPYYVDISNLANPIYVNADGSTFTGVAPAESAKVLLSRAESDDVKLLKINNRNVIQVIDRDTVDITLGATGKLNATSTGVGLNGDVLIGSEGVVNVNLVKSTDDQDVRIKAYGSINNARNDTSAAVVGGNIVLESASGSVGSESAVMRIDQKQDASLVARTKTEMTISTLDQQVSGRAVDLRISSAYSPNSIHLTSKQGAILDNTWTGEGSIENGWGTDIKAANIHLTAAKSIGLMPAIGDTDSNIRGRALEIASVEKLDTDGNPQQSVVIDGDLIGGVNAVTPFTESVRYTSVLSAGNVRLEAQRDLTVDGTVSSTSGSISIQSSAAFGSINDIRLAGQMATNAGAIEVSNARGSIYVGNGHKNLTIQSATGDVSLVSNGVFDASQSPENQAGDIRMSAGSAIDSGTGRINLDAGVGLYFSNLKTSSTNRNAVSLRAFDVVDNVGGKNDAADITLRDSGGLTIKAYRFADINRIDYQGAGDLHIDVLGANSNNNASAAAVALGINANAPVVFDRLYTGYAAVAVKGMTSFEVSQGRITRTGYFDLNGVLGRVGDIDYPSINYALWTREAGGETSAFQNPAMVDGYRKQDFIVSGSAATTGLGIMLYNLKANWTGARPVVTTDGFMLSYSRTRVSYQSADGETMSIDERTAMATMLGMNLRILNSIGLKLEFYNAFSALNQAPTGLGNKRFIQNAGAQTADGKTLEEESTEPAFPANFPPSILDADTSKLDGLNLTSVNMSNESVQ